MRKKKIWFLALFLLVTIACSIYLVSNRQPSEIPLPETKYQLSYYVVSCSVSHDTGQLSVIAQWIDLETNEISSIDHSLSAHEPFLYTSSGERVSTDKIKPGDILIVHTDDATEQAIYPVTFSAPYYLTLLDTPLDASGQAESNAYP
jgi:hypothetical protein